MRTSESPDARRRAIGAAVWRIVRRDGINAVSTRTVAAEAGMVLGSLRHYFPRQSDVIAFAMQLVADRSDERVRSIVSAAGDVHPDAQLLIEQYLPLDAERRDEMEVWLVFAGAALSDPSLAAVKRDSDATMLRRIRLVVAAWSPSGTPGPELDRAAGRLRALTDGLATHLVGPYPAMEPAEARAIVADELDRLSRPHQPHQPHQPHRPHDPR